jgi:hypothetical protein
MLIFALATWRSVSAGDVGRGVPIFSDRNPTGDGALPTPVFATSGGLEPEPAAWTILPVRFGFVVSSARSGESRRRGPVT